GVFGIHDCMGSARSRNFDAVIGVGGKSPWDGHEGIAYKINWIGIKPKKTDAGRRKRGPHVTFEYFVLDDENGPEFKTLAPKVFKYMFEDKHVRQVMSRSLRDDDMQKEITKILRLAKKHNKPKGRFSGEKAQDKCK